MLLRKYVYVLQACVATNIYTLSSTHRFVHNTLQHFISKWTLRYVNDPREHPDCRVHPLLQACPSCNDSVCNGRHKHWRCNKPSPKISHDKVKDAVSPKAKRKTSACTASSLPVNVKVPPLFDTAVYCYWIRSGEEEKGNVRKYTHNKDGPVVCFLGQHMLSGELIVKDPLQICF